MSPLLEVDDLTVQYSRRRRGRAQPPALDGVSIRIEPGETVGLVGESGSGKSTLGNTILGLVPATRGRIIFDGRDITRQSPSQRRSIASRIQAVFQDPYSSFNPNRTVGQSVAETLSTGAPLGRSEVRGRIEAMLDRVGLEASAIDRFPSEFSGGQRQRIAIARALMPSPELIVCDESVSALDLSVQAQVLNLLAELQRDTGVAYLFITHDLSVVRHISDRVIVLRRGVLVEEGTNDEVIDHPREAYTRNLLAAAPVPNPDLQALRRESRRAFGTLTEPAQEPGEAVAPTLAALRTLERRAAYEFARRRDAAPAGLVAAAAAATAAGRSTSGTGTGTGTGSGSADAVLAFHRALVEGSGAADLLQLLPVMEDRLRAALAGPLSGLAGSDRAAADEACRGIANAVSEADAQAALTQVDAYFGVLERVAAPSVATRTSTGAASTERYSEQHDDRGRDERRR